MLETQNYNSGFTLLEVMIAMAILSIGILAMTGMQYRNVGGNSHGNIITQETMLAQQIMERLKNTTTPSSLTAGSLTGVDEFGEAGGGYNVTWTISNPIGGSMSRFITVVVQHTKVTSSTSDTGGRRVTLNSLTQGKGI